jgi:hypothetical protein
MEIGGKSLANSRQITQKTLDLMEILLREKCDLLR